ncbi:MAG: hypothetical protein L6R19_17835 [Alphaproteobacteria bacterium]|nr:hypothetical protein [Alphaproteobacteria bacterium]
MSDSTAGLSTPGVSDFRVGAILARANAIFSRNYSGYLPVIGIAELPLLIGPQSGDIAVSLIVNMILSAIAYSAVLLAAFADLRGRRLGAIEAVFAVAPFALSLIAVLLLNLVVVLMGMLLLVVPGLILATVLFAAVPACAIERKKVMECWSRSAELTKGYRWRVFAIAGGFGIAFMVVELIVGLVRPFEEHSLVADALMYLWQVVWVAYLAVVQAVAYHDLRVLKDGGIADVAAA